MTHDLKWKNIVTQLKRSITNKNIMHHIKTTHNFAGVTSTSPMNLNFPNTMTDLDHDAWMLSGSSVLQDGITIQNGYACDLDKLKEGDRLGIMRKSDSTLHFFINEEDCGVAATSVPPGRFASESRHIAGIFPAIFYFLWTRRFHWLVMKWVLAATS